jgi:hypothetical protein
LRDSGEGGQRKLEGWREALRCWRTRCSRLELRRKSHGGHGDALPSSEQGERNGEESEEDERWEARSIQARLGVHDV